MKYKKDSAYYAGKIILVTIILLFFLVIVDSQEPDDKTYEEILTKFNEVNRVEGAKLIVDANPSLRNKLIAEIRGIKNAAGFENANLISDGTKIGNGKVWIDLQIVDFAQPDSIEYDGKSLTYKFNSQRQVQTPPGVPPKFEGPLNVATIKFDEGRFSSGLGGASLVSEKYGRISIELDRGIDFTLEDGKITGTKSIIDKGKYFKKSRTDITVCPQHTKPSRN